MGPSGGEDYKSVLCHGNKDSKNLNKHIFRLPHLHTARLHEPWQNAVPLSTNLDSRETCYDKFQFHTTKDHHNDLYHHEDDKNRTVNVESSCSQGLKLKNTSAVCKQ